MEATKKLVEAVLPPEVLLWFSLEDVQDKDGELQLLLEEKPIPPVYEEKLEAHGFLPTKEIQDFPIRGKLCALLSESRCY